MSDYDQPVRAAATVIIVRDIPDGQAELLMMERARTMAFAAGAMVFPGGAVDASDRALAATFDHGLDLDEAAARIAAIRETLEECGLGVGFAGSLDAALLAGMRAALLAGKTLADLLDSQGIALDLDQLVPFARWQPSVRELASRVYDTRFYLVQAPPNQEATADASENVRLFWETAENVLSRSDGGELRIIYPTRRNLERLAQFDAFPTLAAHAASIPVEKIMPWFEDRQDGRFLCIPGHLGYPVTAEPVASAMRE